MPSAPSLIRPQTYEGTTKSPLRFDSTYWLRARKRTFAETAPGG
jgi:hypothetical protein